MDVATWLSHEQLARLSVPLQVRSGTSMAALTALEVLLSSELTLQGSVEVGEKYFPCKAKLNLSPVTWQHSVLKLLSASLDASLMCKLNQFCPSYFFPCRFTDSVL